MGKFLVASNLACFRFRNERLFRHYSAAHMDDAFYFYCGAPRDLHLQFLLGALDVSHLYSGPVQFGKHGRIFNLMQLSPIGGSRRYSFAFLHHWHDSDFCYH